MLKAGGMGHETEKIKIDDDNLHFKEKIGEKKKRGKGGTSCKNILLLAIDISKSQRFTITAVTNKTKGDLVGICYIIRLTGLTK